MTSRIGKAFSMALLAGLLLAPEVTEGQGKRPPRTDREEREQLERDIQTRFDEMIRRELGLTDDQVERLRDILRRFQEERATIRDSDLRLRRRGEELGLAVADRSEEEANRGAEELLEAMFALRKKELELLVKERDELLKVLTPLQTVHFLRMREDFGRRIRELRIRRVRRSEERARERMR